MENPDRTRTLVEPGGTPAPARPMPAAIGPYRVVGLLGEGGMGVVWEAEQQHPSRRVAVKVMREAHHFSDLQARMFEREVETLGRLKHTNIAAIYESGWTEGGHGWFAMELVRGETLDRWLATRPDPFARDEMVLRLRLFQTVCAAVNYAHQRGVIHRDLKPTNIAVLADAAGAAESAGASPHRDLAPPVKVLDFSLARFADAGEDAGSLLTRAGVVRGTPQYMSPEQARGETTTLDVRTDVYPLGMILYELLARARPYSLSGLTMVEAVRVICETPPRPLREVWRGARRLDPDLETIVGKALEKEPDRRYPSAAALSDDVTRYLNAEPIAARPPSRVYRARKFLARHRLGVAVAAAAVVLLAGFGASMAVQARRVARERDRANLEAQAFKRVAGFMAGMFRVSDPSEARGNSITAREILDKAAGQIDRDLAEDPALQARLLSQMGEVYRNLGLYAKAEPMVERAIEIDRRVLGERDPETLRAMLGRVTLMAQTGRYPEAEKASRELLDLQTRALGPDDPIRIRTFNNIAIACWYQGRLPEARALYEQALDLARRTVGTRHPDALGTMNNLALVDLDEERIGEAEHLFREVYEVRKEVSGADHPDTLKSQVNIGLALQHGGRLDEAEAIYRDNYDARRRILGPEHPDTLMSMGTLASINQELGRLKEAEELQRALLDARRRSLGEDNPDTLRTMNDLANTFDIGGRHREAEALYRDLIARRARVLGPEAEETLSAHLDLAEALRNQGRYREARDEAASTLAAMRRVLEPGDSLLGEALYGLACTEALDGRRDRAIEVLAEALGAIPAPTARRLPTDPALQSLHADARFAALVTRAAEAAKGR